MDNPLTHLQTFKKLQDLDLKGKKVLVRVDYNVPLNPDGTIADPTRIRESLPTLQYILQAGGSIILMSHLGRPKGKRSPEFSLALCAKELSSLLDIPVLMAPDCIGQEVKAMAQKLSGKQVLLLENLRFYPAEEKPQLDLSFAKQLSELGDVYINDAFGTAHREHSSTATIAQYFPGRKGAGLLMQKEIAFFSKLLVNPARPFYAIIGGSKISTKIGVLSSLTMRVQSIFIGGAMAFTFLKSQGISIGASLCEEEHIPTASAFIKECAAKGVALHLPQDLLIADAFQADAASQVINANAGIPDKWIGMDIGPQTIAAWCRLLPAAATLFWNGPVGVFEFPRFAHGTEEIARCLASLQGKTTTVVGGGDSISAIQHLHLGDRFSHLSTGGGASLELMEFGHLPGIDALCE